MSIYKVAKIAGVSTATVSRVINNKSNVLPETRRRVMDTIESLGLNAGELGRSNRDNKRDIVLMTFPTMTNLLYDDMLRGASDCAEKYEADLVFGDCYNSIEKERSFCRIAREKQYSGIILVSPQITAEEINELASQIPVVQCSDYREQSNTPIISVNDEKTAYDAVTYLVSLGLKKIGMVSAIDVQSSSLARERGYIKAIRDAGLQYDPSYIVRSSYEFRESESYARELLSAHDDMDGVFCISDTIAYNVIKVAKELGKRVPEDISVFGHDNVFLSEICEPSITTINQESYKIGYYAVKTLFEQKNIESYLRNNMKTYIEHSIVVRNSTLKAK